MVSRRRLVALHIGCSDWECMGGWGSYCLGWILSLFQFGWRCVEKHTISIQKTLEVCLTRMSSVSCVSLNRMRQTNNRSWNNMLYDKILQT